jgi:deoxycytidine triphosphate deaminase
MPILNADQIRGHIRQGELITDPRLNDSGVPQVERASYDLRAGIVVWKDTSSPQLKILRFSSIASDQPVVTLSPGQMLFVITHEELNMPANVCGTVYSRNKLQKENILALNAGHVDPGYQGPIIIRLINLSKVEWALTLGEPVFTVVFHSVDPPSEDNGRDVRSKEETLLVALKTASQAFSNPLHDLYTDELQKHFDAYETKLEKTMRDLMSKEFFGKDDINKLALKVLLAASGLLVAAFALFRLPWGELFRGLAHLLGK